MALHDNFKDPATGNDANQGPAVTRARSGSEPPPGLRTNRAAKVNESQIMVDLRPVEQDVLSDLALTDEQLALLVVGQKNSAQALQAAREAFGQLYRRHSTRLLAFLAARLHGGDLEEVHQEVWFRAWERLPRSFHGGTFSAWMYQVSRHHLIDRSRRRSPVALREDADFVDNHALPDELFAQQERQAVLMRCLGRLRGRMAELVRARLAGESYAEICLRLGLLPKSAHKMFHRAKEFLKTCVGRALQ